MTFHIPPLAGQVGDFEFHWQCRYAYGEARGGDAVFAERDRADGNVMFLLVDVTGHGDPAAETARYLIGRVLQQPTFANLSPSELLTSLNARLQQHWAAKCRSVAAYAVLAEGNAGRLVASKAGMYDPAVGQIGTAVRQVPLPHGYDLGWPVPDGTYGEVQLALAANEWAVFCSDGVYQCPSSTRSGQFGARGLEAALGGFRHAIPLQSAVPFVQRPATVSLEEVGEDLLGRLRDFMQTKWPEDDTTILLFRRSV
jgi:serine phosphatase RsbU (regulator of sigma subunit)